MTATELQRSIIERVGKVESHDQLQSLDAYLTSLTEQKSEHWNTLSDQEMQRILKAVEDFQNGAESGIPDSVVEERNRKWL